MSPDPVIAYLRAREANLALVLANRKRVALKMLDTIERSRALAHNAYTRYMQHAGFETGRKALERFTVHDEKYGAAIKALRAAISEEPT